MKHTDHNLNQPRSSSARIGALLGALLALVLLAATPASAAFEQTGIFAGSLTPPVKPGVFPEDVQLGGVSGMAVNIDGAGGVPAGTVYAAAVPSLEELQIARYNPDGSFSEAWEVRTFGGEEYERCGPDGEIAHPHCVARPEGIALPVDVDVDQTTGYVYVLDGSAQVAPNVPVVAVYTADGSKLITRFGGKAPTGKTTAETPEQIHASGLGGIAVDDSGTAYVFDINYQDNFYHRLMVFKPQTPDDYEHYVYTGADHDVGAGFLNESKYPSGPVADANGDIYVAGEDHIEKYDPSQPSDPPLCEFTYPKGGITAMTVNPDNGEAFFFNSKDRKVHRLSPCNEKGEFTELESFKVAPERDHLYGLTFDPVQQIEPSRAAGVLYGGAPRAVPAGGGKGEPGQSSLGYIFAHTKEVAPVIASESVSHVTSTTATLAAQINPKGSKTSYVFQYVTQAEYEANEPTERFAGAAEAPLGGAVLEGNGQEAVAAAIALSGLAPDATYHYRAVATSHCSEENPAKACEGTGADQSFRTFPAEAPALPDKRVWELISPTQKHGGQVFPADPTISSCGLIYCKPGSTDTHFPMQSSPDGNAVVYEGSPFSSSEGAVIENQYISRRDPEAGWQTTNLTPGLLASKGDLGYKAFNASLGEGVLEQASPSLSPEAPSEYTNLYLQSTDAPSALSPLLRSEPPDRLPGAGAGHLDLTYAGASADFSRQFFAANDALTEESPFAPEAIDGGVGKSNLYEWVGGQLRLVNVLPGNAETIPGAEFGERGAHAISSDGSRAFWSDEAGQVYVRINGETTKAIPDPGKFLGASADGSKVLLDDGHVYDLESETTTDLSQGKGGFEGIAGQSEDLSRIYFVDRAALAPGTEPGACKMSEETLQKTEEKEGKVPPGLGCNLYVWDEGSTTFIATLFSSGGKGTWAFPPYLRTAEASPDGNWLAFTSRARLTGYDNTGPCEPVGETGKFLLAPCDEAFFYDSATAELACVSCNPSGERPSGRTVLRKGWQGSQPRYLIDSGRLYFDSEDSLSPFDTNEGVEDVYQYEPEGVGSCKRAAGCVSLISAGHEAVDSNFLAIDDEGKNVFFTTRDQLALKDRDEAIDLYDAREGGGIPSETETARSECQGEACQPAVVAPNDPTPGSSSFEGPGNVNEKKQSKKHKKKKHAKKHAHKRAAKHNRGGVK